MTTIRINTVKAGLLATLLSFSCVFDEAARADDVDIEISCPSSVAASQPVVVTFTITSSSSFTVDSLYTTLTVGEKERTLLGEIPVFGPFNRLIDPPVVVTPGSPFSGTVEAGTISKKSTVGLVGAAGVAVPDDDGNLASSDSCTFTVAGRL